MTGGRPARDYLALGERRRLFWMLMPAGVALIVVLGWVERSWFPRRGDGQPQIDTRLEAVAGPPPQGDEIVIERDPEPLDQPAAALSASLDSLARVRDATVFREADNDAWFQTWTTLRSTGMEGLRRARPREVGFRELFGQPRSFRGRLVRMRGTLHRAERLTAPRNDYGVTAYWQCWLEPAGGPPSPVVVQCLTLPAAMPTGMDINEPVEIIGYFFKNYAYNAADTIRVAPVIMTVEPIRRPLAAKPPGPLSGPGGVTLALAATLAAVVAATWLGTTLATRRRAAVVPDAVGLDAALADLEPFSVEESLRRAAADAAAAHPPRDPRETEP